MWAQAMMSFSQGVDRLVNNLKLRLSTSQVPQGHQILQSGTKKESYILTPDNIPKFQIPTNIRTRRRGNQFQTSHSIANDNEVKDQSLIMTKCDPDCLDRKNSPSDASSENGTTIIKSRSPLRRNKSLPRRRQNISYTPAHTDVLAGLKPNGNDSLSARELPTSRSSLSIQENSPVPSTIENPVSRRRKSYILLKPTTVDCTEYCDGDETSGEEMSPLSWSGPSSDPICHSCFVRYRKQNPLNTADYLGELYLSLKYYTDTNQLKVVIKKASQLGGMSSLTENMCSFVKVSIIPGLAQKQYTNIVRNSTCPVFDDTMYFDFLTKEDLKESAVMIKLYKKSIVWKNELIGEVSINIATLGDLSHELQMWRDVKPAKEETNCGKLDVSIKFVPQKERLAITVNKATGLQRHILTGAAPDSYVKIVINQPNRIEYVATTAVLKGQENPVFKETVFLSISPKISDLKYTRVTLTIMSKTKVRLHNAIGQVILGYMSTEEAEIDHWNCILQNPGQVVSWQHTIMEPEKSQSVELVNY